jgi:hypothetical protein
VTLLVAPEAAGASFRVLLADDSAAVCDVGGQLQKDGGQAIRWVAGWGGGGGG